MPRYCNPTKPPSSDFRKACRPRFDSHPLQVQRLPENPRTCFEGPFGEVIRATGPMAKANPFRFSTKYQDDETDLLYYGYRYYNASTGRWLSRDPIEERSGLGLYRFVESQPLDTATDCDGRITYTLGPSHLRNRSATRNQRHHGGLRWTSRPCTMVILCNRLLTSSTGKDATSRELEDNLCVDWGDMA